MIDKSKFFKKVKKQWRYYPFGTINEDVFLIVKDGQKQNFIDALNAEWSLVFPMLLCSSGLAVFFGEAAIWIPFAFYIPYFFINRTKIEKRFCEYKSYSKMTFFKSYGKMVYFFLDEDDEHRFRMLLFGIAFFGFSFYYSFFERFNLVGIIFSASFFILSFLVLSMMIIKRNKKDKSK